MLKSLEVRQDSKQLFTSSSLVVNIAAVCLLPRIGLLCDSKNVYQDLVCGRSSRDGFLDHVKACRSASKSRPSKHKFICCYLDMSDCCPTLFHNLTSTSSCAVHCSSHRADFYSVQCRDICKDMVMRNKEENERPAAQMPRQCVRIMPDPQMSTNVHALSCSQQQFCGFYLETLVIPPLLLLARR